MGPLSHLEKSNSPHSKLYCCPNVFSSALPHQALPSFLTPLCFLGLCLQDICPWTPPSCWHPQGFCPNLPSRMTMHSRMAIRAPVLRPAEDRNASPWHMRVLPWRWHGHTRSVRVLVPLSDGSPPSQTTMGSSYSSWVRWLKRRRLAMMLAVLSKTIKWHKQIFNINKTDWKRKKKSKKFCFF